MEDQMRTKIPYAEIAEMLKRSLNLRGSPVAVKLARKPEDIPDGVGPIEETVRHCQMVSRARLKGEIFYATTERHACMGGAWALGLREITESLSTGEFYYKLGKFETWAACMRTIQQVPHLPEPTTYATVYAPLEKTPFDPHVVLIIAEPRAMLKLAQAELYLLGLRRCDSAAIPLRKGQLLPRLRRFAPVLRDRGQRTCYGDPRRTPAGVRPGTPDSHRCAGLGEVSWR